MFLFFFVGVLHSFVSSCWGCGQGRVVNFQRATTVTSHWIGGTGESSSYIVTVTSKGSTYPTLGVCYWHSRVYPQCHHHTRLHVDFQHHRNTYPSRRGNLVCEKGGFRTTLKPHARFVAISRQLEARKLHAQKALGFLTFRKGCYTPPHKPSKFCPRVSSFVKQTGLPGTSEKSGEIQDFPEIQFLQVFVRFLGLVIIMLISQNKEFVSCGKG